MTMLGYYTVYQLRCNGCSTIFVVHDFFLEGKPAETPYHLCATCTGKIRPALTLPQNFAALRHEG